jgi:hypothetical protein
MDRKDLSVLNENFKAFIMPLLNENDPEEYHLIREFQKLFHSKRVEILTTEWKGLRNWRESSRGR